MSTPVNGLPISRPDDVPGLTAALDSKADASNAARLTGAAQTIGAATTFTTTVTASVPHAALATVARWVNPLSTGGDYSWVIGGPGNFDGQIQLVHATVGRILRVRTQGIAMEAGYTIAVGNNGGIAFEPNGNTAVTFDTEGATLRGLNRLIVNVAGAVRALFLAAYAYITTPLYVGSTAAGSANAQLESRSKDATTPAFACYDSAGLPTLIVQPGFGGQLVKYIDMYSPNGTDNIFRSDLGGTSGKATRLQAWNGTAWETGVKVENVASGHVLTTLGGPTAFPELTDADIPIRGIAWSTDTPNTLKCRTPAGTLKTIT